MKRLILIENDCSGCGKTTLAACLHRYLESYRVPHHRVSVVESADEAAAGAQIEATALRMPALIAELDRSDLVIMEIESGLGDLFNGFYDKQELDHLLPEIGFELSVLVPVTGDRESFEGVAQAAEAFSDGAQYLIVHTPTSSSYDGDGREWDRSHAARIMDMFEAADLDMPAANESLEVRLKLAHTDLAHAVEQPVADADLQAEVTRWTRRVTGQIEAARNYIFGDAFRPAIAIAPPAKRRRRAKAKLATEAAA